MAFNRKQKLRDNIEAIRTAFTLDREGRTPTERERVLLGRYCGFGGLKCILNPARELTDAVHWAKSDLELFAPTVELHRIIRENSRDDMEYKRYTDSLKASVLTAFYTPQAITDTIADVLHDRKVRPRLVLEPSAGMGAFINPVLSNNPQAEVTAFEKDLLTGKMLGHLYPQQKIRTEGFEKIEKPFLNRFDLAISNIPFGDIAVFDAEYEKKSVMHRIAAKKVHTYFFLKGLDAVRDGGVVAFITSQSVLNTEGNGGTRYLMMKQADLLSAIRLPNNLFTENANTEVGCDLIILQKNINKMDLSEEDSKYSINSLVYWVTYVHNVVYSFYRSMIYCYINSTQRCAGSIEIDIIPTNGADKRKFSPFAPYFPVTNVIKRYFYPYFPAIIGIKGYSFPYFPYLSGIMKIKTALYSLFSRLDWHKTVVFPCLGEIYEGIRSLSWEIPVT